MIKNINFRSIKSRLVRETAVIDQDRAPIRARDRVPKPLADNTLADVTDDDDEHDRPATAATRRTRQIPRRDRRQVHDRDRDRGGVVREVEVAEVVAVALDIDDTDDVVVVDIVDRRVDDEARAVVDVARGVTIVAVGVAHDRDRARHDPIRGRVHGRDLDRDRDRTSGPIDMSLNLNRTILKVNLLLLISK